MNRFINWCRRYVSLILVGVIAFVIYAFFFDENSVGRMNELNVEIRRLKTEIKANQDTMEHYRALNRRLDTSAAEMERIVREQYHMQRPNEDVYIVVEEE